jgi:WD40 repeat protein
LAEWNIDSLSDMTWTPDGSLLVVASQSGIFFFDALRRELLRELYPQATHLVEIDFSPTSAWLISASREGTEESGFISRLELWQGPGWKPRGLIYDIPLAISDISFSPDGKALAAAFSSPIAERNELDFWDVSSWLITETLQTGPLLNIEISPDAELLASSPDLYALRVMDLGEKSWIYNLKTSFTGAVNSFAFSPDGLFLASGHYDGVIRIWDMRTGLLKLEFQSQEVIQSLVFSSDGRLLASGGSYESNLVRLWDPSTGLLLRTLEGHTSGVTHLLFSPENQFLVSGSYDGILRIWGIRP